MSTSTEIIKLAREKYRAIMADPKSDTITWIDFYSGFMVGYMAAMPKDTQAGYGIASEKWDILDEISAG